MQVPIIKACELRRLGLSWPQIAIALSHLYNRRPSFQPDNVARAVRNAYGTSVVRT